MKKKAFTLLEVVFSLVVFGIIFGVLFTLFIRIIRTKTDIQARQTLVQVTYDAIEQINTKMQNYSIDYEEYFNRSMVGCMSNTIQGSSFTWRMTGSDLGYCPMRTAYGNHSPFFGTRQNHVSSATQHKLYMCSSDKSLPIPAAGCILNALTNGQVYGSIGGSYPEERLVVSYTAGDMGCSDLLYTAYSGEPSFGVNGGFRQPFGAYKTQFLDIRGEADDTCGRAGDDDDTDTGLGPVAIRDNTNVKELYLISPDKRKRIFFRRALIATGDWNNNGTIDSDNERLYAIQMLQMRAFDAGENHDFNATGFRGVFDGVTDTWACDYEAGFICNGSGVGPIYTGYRLPLNNNDGWINLLNSDVSVADWNMHIFPIKDPIYAWGESQYQVNPYIRLYIKTTLYGRDRVGRIGIDLMDDIVFDVQTTINIKSHY